MSESFDHEWAFLQKNLAPGVIIPNWTVLKGYLGDSMRVVEVEDVEIVIRPPNAKSDQHVSREEFERIWEVWPAYKNGQKQRQEIREITRYSKYIISVLRWMEIKQG